MSAILYNQAYSSQGQNKKVSHFSDLKFWTCILYTDFRLLLSFRFKSNTYNSTNTTDLQKEQEREDKKDRHN